MESNNFINIVYDKLDFYQKQEIKNFIKNNFPEIPIDKQGLLSNTVIILNVINDNIYGLVCLLNNNTLKKYLLSLNVSLDDYCFEKIDGVYIYNLCVDKNYRNKGIGNKLINHVIDLCLMNKIDYVHTRAENDFSKIIFYKNGFIDSGISNKNEIMSKFL
jgi:ribosomal protein S18 acetylase RimI-like enzyme